MSHLGGQGRGLGEIAPCSNVEPRLNMHHVTAESAEQGDQYQKHNDLWVSYTADASTTNNRLFYDIPIYKTNIVPYRFFHILELTSFLVFFSKGAIYNFGTLVYIMHMRISSPHEVLGRNLVFLHGNVFILLHFVPFVVGLFISS